MAIDHVRVDLVKEAGEMVVVGRWWRCGNWIVRAHQWWCDFCDSLRSIVDHTTHSCCYLSISILFLFYFHMKIKHK